MADLTPQDNETGTVCPLIHRWENTGLQRGVTCLPQVTSEAGVGPGLELCTHSWTHSVFYMLSPACEQDMPKETQSQMCLVYISVQPSRCLELTRLEASPNMSVGKVPANPLHSCAWGLEAPITIMVGTRSIQSLGCPGAYPSSCHSQLSKGASWCVRPCCPANAGACSKAFSKQFTASVFPLPEPIRALDIGICLCTLSKSSVPGPGLQKVPSDILKGFIDIKKLSLPTAPPAERQSNS